MILSYSYYQTLRRKGILFFHQRTPTASGTAVAQTIFSAFVSILKDVLKDQDSTRIPMPNDMGDPEIQMLESAKLRTLRSLPQSSTYWGSELFYAHVSSENLYLKIPKWFKVYGTQSDEFHGLELDQSWTKLTVTPDSTLFLTLENPYNISTRLVEVSKGSFRIAPLLCKPTTEFLPLFTLQTKIEG